MTNETLEKIMLKKNEKEETRRMVVEEKWLVACLSPIRSETGEELSIVKILKKEPREVKGTE